MELLSCKEVAVVFYSEYEDVFKECLDKIRGLSCLEGRYIAKAYFENLEVYYVDWDQKYVVFRCSDGFLKVYSRGSSISTKRFRDFVMAVDTTKLLTGNRDAIVGYIETRKAQGIVSVSDTLNLLMPTKTSVRDVVVDVSVLGLDDMYYLKIECIDANIVIYYDGTVSYYIQAFGTLS